MKQLLLTFIALSFLSFDLQGQKRLSLQECISLALDKSLTLQEAELSIENAEINQAQAKANRYPNLNGFGGLNYNFGRSIDPTSNEFITSPFTSNNYGLSSNVLIYGGRRIANAIVQSEIDYNITIEQKRQSEADIALQVSTAYLNSLFAIENINVAEAQLKQTQQQLDFINKLINAGARPENDRLDILAQISTNESNIIQAKNNQDISLLQLKQLIRIDPNEDILIAAPSNIEVATDPDLVTFIEAYELTLRSQPAIMAALLQEESAAYNIKIAEADKLPSLSLGSNLNTAYSNRGFRRDGTETIEIPQDITINGIPTTISLEQEFPVIRDANFGEQFQDNISLGVGLNLSVPIYNRGITNNNIQRAKLGLKSSELATARLKENVQILVQQSLADARAAKKSLAASEKIVEARKAALDNAIKKFESGSLNTFDLTNIQTQLDNASINFLIDKYNYLFAVKVLEFYMGKPFKL